MKALSRFLVLGAALFAVGRASEWEREPPPLNLPRLAGENTRGGSGSPSLRDDQDLLLAAAWASGIAEDDVVVQRRLRESAHAVELDSDSGASVGLANGDPIIARRLVQQMQLQLASEARRTEPTDAELHTYVVQHAGRFMLPERVRVTHLFFSHARRGDHTERDAMEGLRRVRTAHRNGRTDSDGAHCAPYDAACGDPFLWPAELPLQSAMELEKIFGAAVSAIVAAPLDEWTGPHRSAMGYHLVRVRERIPATPPPFDAIRAAVRLAWLNDRAERHVQQTLAALR